MNMPASEAKYCEAFQRVHPASSFEAASTKEAVLVLGAARSGTSWLSQALHRADNAGRLFNEPLFHVQPPLPFDRYTPEGPYYQRSDHTAISYAAELEEDHPLWCVYQALTGSSPNTDQLLGSAATSIVKEGPSGGGRTLIKEVHALLATEGLVKRWQGPVVFITRDPAKAVDSLLSFRTLRAHMWRKESEHVAQTGFLERFAPDSGEAVLHWFRRFKDDGVDQTSTVVCKVLTVALINRMLSMLAKQHEHCLLLRYESLCLDPEPQFYLVARHCGLDMGEAMQAFLWESTHAASANKKQHPYSIYRQTNTQLQSPFDLITSGQEHVIGAMLEECDLAGSENQALNHDL